MIIPNIEYKKLFILKPISLLSAIVKRPLLPKKSMYEIAIIIAGIVSGILERERRNLLAKNDRFAQKKEIGRDTNIANNEDKNEWVIVKIKIDIKGELLLLVLFRMETFDEKKGLKDAKRGIRKKNKHKTKERKPKSKTKLCKEFFNANSFLSFWLRCLIYFKAFIALSTILSKFSLSNFNTFLGDGTS